MFHNCLRQCPLIHQPWRGLTDPTLFVLPCMSQVALAYSGVRKGLTATVLRMEVSDVDGAASISEFSQYPGEEEWLWNVLTYLQYQEGEEELCTTPWGLVRMITVKGVSPSPSRMLSAVRLGRASESEVCPARRVSRVSVMSQPTRTGATRR